MAGTHPREHPLSAPCLVETTLEPSLGASSSPSNLHLTLSQGVIEGRRDIRGGRLASDRRAAGNLSSGAAFTSLTYSADGSFLLAGEALVDVPSSICVTVPPTKQGA